MGNSKGQDLHGTINIAFAKSNGFVLVTDSRLTGTDKSGKSSPISQPGKKLFQLDENTFCLLAGDLGKQITSTSALYISAAGIIESFRQETQRFPRFHQSFNQKLQALFFLFDLHLYGISKLEDFIVEARKSNHYFSLIMAGYDSDGTPKIGWFKINIERSFGEKGQELISIKREAPEEITVSGGFYFRLGGESDKAEQILKNPQNFKIVQGIQRYSQLLNSQKTSDITIEEMKELALALVAETEKEYPKTVGGDIQVAVLKDGKIVYQEQPDFYYEIPHMPIRIREHNRFDRFPNLSEQESTIPLYFENWIGGGLIRLDGLFFFKNEFRNVVFFYDGGPAVFGQDNSVEMSRLIIGKHADSKSPFVENLIRGFNWDSVIYQGQ